MVPSSSPLTLSTPTVFCELILNFASDCGPTFLKGAAERDENRRLRVTANFADCISRLKPGLLL